MDVARDNGIRSNNAISSTSVLNASIGAECRIGRGDEYLLVSFDQEEVTHASFSIAQLNSAITASDSFSIA
jgi:hypothetical protein